MAIGGALGDGYAALVGLSYTKIFDVNNPNASNFWSMGGFRATWIKNHKLLLGGDYLCSLDARNGKTSEFFIHSKILLLCVHPLNATFYVYTSDNTVVFYDMSRRLPTHTIPLEPSIPLLTSLVVCPDSQKLVATTIDGRVLGWSLLSGHLENNQLIPGAASLVKVQAVGHGVVVVLDNNGFLYWLDLARQWLYMLQAPTVLRNNLVYNGLRGTLYSSFGSHVEVLTATSRDVLDLSKYGDIIDMGVSRDGHRLVVLHGHYLTISSLETGEVTWYSYLDQPFTGEKELVVIPFCS